ncbi:hypothetical protein [Dehalogenimonas etheniformans]|uniref:Uncharacterized protein n=1 Tax=Dehalogenimonas etheniformans TaxID=1536648 RepID=A0A2P5P6G1_9CHLR|nr:hypothetical protein [Dehalogenimonas etheniformans]PPD57859.1 hypothetical protein JP09_006035 [Dehalogenimonas etheniformans]QNT75489.1 hypothetical protein HX448_01700 [Dehalogenimonas etheniformans]
MFSEPLRASDFRVVSFQAPEEEKLDKKVNDWLRSQNQDVVIYKISFAHALAGDSEAPGWSFAMTLAYGNKPVQR